jgi:NIMA (never in mitosis gene a)-related kinase
MHRDLKSANVFLNRDETVKLGDMNVSKVATKEGLNFTQTGTPYYASPEVWKDEPYDIKSDIWSLGCVLYEMIALKPPFQASSMKGLYKRVCYGKFQRIPKTYSVELWAIVKLMLNTNPKLRPDCNKILESQIIHNKRSLLLKQDQAVRQQQSQTHSELLKTIIFPKNNWLSLRNKLPEPRYTEPVEAE